MLFNGGLVPTYIMYSQFFHIRDTIFALLIPSFLMSPFNVILMRNYFKTNIPDAIIEAAKLDGASELRTLVNVVLPMSTPIIGTIGLMSGLAYWNDWTNGLYYLVKRTDLYSIQNVLTNMLNNIQFLKTATQLQGINIEMGTLPSVSIPYGNRSCGCYPGHDRVSVYSEIFRQRHRHWRRQGLIKRGKSMSDWKKYMEQSDAYAASLCKKSHKVYDVDPYVMVFEDEDVPGIFHIYYDAHSKGASAWMHLIVGHATIVYTNDRI